MADRDDLDKWKVLEHRSEEFAARTASCVSEFFDPVSGMFEVSFQAGDKYPKPSAKPLAPNAASALIGLVVFRCQEAGWTLKGREWKDLRDQVQQSRAKLIGFPPEQILPLRSFGVLPVFSTSYLAQWLPDCIGAQDDANLEPLLQNASYAVAIRRLLADIYPVSRSLHDSSNSAIHPFLLLNAARSFQALQAFSRRLEKLGKGPVVETFRKAICDGAGLAVGIGSKALSPKDYESVLLIGRPEFERYLSDTKFSEVLEQALQAIEDIARNDVLAELANYNRSSDSSPDTAKLAYGMLILSNLSPRRHSALIQQGLSALIKSVRQGSFASGSPFYSDDKGRALFVPSIEVANIAVLLALREINTLPKEKLVEVIEKTTAIHDLLVESCNTITIENTVGTFVAEKEVRGWCSDKAPSATRVDSWITIQVLEFFVNRINLLRWSKRSLVFSEYNVTRHEDCRVDWNKVQDPDEGYLTNTVKLRIEAIMSDAHKGAPVFLLYGPPGTSKTTLATALAASRKWDLISLSPSDFIADSLDRIEYRSRKIFRDLMNVDKCVILMDEMDSLFRDRRIFAQRPGTVIEYVIPALLPKLQDLRDYCIGREMAVFYVTNYFETIDSAISRGGRMDNKLLTLPYSLEARRKVVAQTFDMLDLPTTHLPGLLAVLEELPCNHVYRDVVDLVKLAASGVAPDKLLADGAACGVSPEVYDHHHRIGAYREFCMFISRLINLPVDENTLRSQKGAVVQLQKCAVAMAGRGHFAEWESLTAGWLAALSKV
jgi:adenylate kinase family enzyme